MTICLTTPAMAYDNPTSSKTKRASHAFTEQVIGDERAATAIALPPKRLEAAPFAPSSTAPSSTSHTTNTTSSPALVSNETLAMSLLQGLTHAILRYHSLTRNSVNNELIVSMWPTDLPSCAQITKPPSQLDEHELVPDDTNALDDWAYVRQRSDVRDNARRSIYVLSRAPQARPDEIFEVSLRLQGFVQSCVLTPLGSWIRCDLHVEANLFTEYSL